MKTWMIVKKDNLEIQRAYTYEAEAKDDTSKNRSYLLAEPNCVHLEVPEGMHKDSVKAVLDDDVIVLETDAALETARLAKIKEAAILVKYEEMQADVLAGMSAVFGTTKPESAQAYHETWKKMVEGPSAYANQGLKSDRQLRNATNDVIFEEGAALNTNQKITDYATRLLELADSYAIERMVRIQQFRDEKAAILAG